MDNQRLLFLFLLIVISSSVTIHAQGTFSYTYDIGNTSNVPYGLTKDEHSNIYVMDYAKCNLEENLECVNLSKFNEFGAKLWTKRYSFDSLYQYRGGGQGCLDVSNGEIVMVGDEERRPGYHRFFIAFWDTSGVLLDTFFYDFVPAVGNSFVRAVLKYNDSTYFAYGNEELAPTNNTLFLSKINRQGEELWRRHFGSGMDWLPDPESLVIYQDSFLLLGCTEKFGLGSEPLIICTDLNGVEQWSSFVEEEQDLGDARLKVLSLHNGDIIYSFSFDSSALLHNNVFVKRIDEDRNEIWTHQFPYASRKGVFALTTAANGDIIGVGSYFGVWQGQREFLGWVFRISLDGVLRWERDIHESMHNAGIVQYFLDVVEQDDHIFIIGGLSDTIGLGVENNNSWIVRLDSNGRCSGDDCPDIVEVYTATKDHKPLRSELEPLTLFPNPAKAEFHLIGTTKDMALVSLFNMDGRMVKSWRVDQADEAMLKLSLNFVSPGQYVVLTQNRRGEMMGVGKLVVE